MAIINCPECGKEISDKSEKCIHCGYPLSNWYKIVLTGYSDTETFATEGLRQALHFNYDYEILSNILNKCPYELGKFTSEKDALECAGQLKKWPLKFYIEDSQGNIIDDKNILPSITPQKEKRLTFWNLVWAIVIAVVIVSIIDAILLSILL